MGLIVGLEEKLPSGFLLTTVEKLAGYMRKNFFGQQPLDLHVARLK
jgi:hypothetical protein